MTDVMALLRDRRAKAEAKLLRASKALELAKNELADLQAAERVVSSITGESPAETTSHGSISDRDKEITKILDIGADEAMSPADLFPLYVEATDDNINLDTFRTALWRLRKKIIQGGEQTWVIRSMNGKYWREVASESDQIEDLLG